MTKKKILDLALIVVAVVLLTVLAFFVKPHEQYHKMSNGMPDAGSIKKIGCGGNCGWTPGKIKE